MASAVAARVNRKKVRTLIGSIESSSPMLLWFLRQLDFGARYKKPMNFIIPGIVAKRFSLGVGDNGRAVVGVADEDVVSGATWQGVSLIRKRANYDWVVLTGTLASGTTAKFWLPVDNGKLDGFSVFSDGEDVDLIQSYIRDGQVHPVSETEPFATVPLAKLGEWDDLATASESVGSKNYFQDDDEFG